MLAIRLQRTGRSSHAMFRLIAQDSRMSPMSGKIAEQLGSYDPHTKAATLNKERVAFFLDHGAQPSPRVAVLLQKEGVKLPAWVELPPKKSGKVRNQDKLRKNKPKEEKAPVQEAPAEPAAEEPKTEPEAPEAEVAEK